MLHAFLIATALFIPGAAQADDGCDFAPPKPLLKSHAYAGQSFKRDGHTAVETARLGGGVDLTINHSQCVDEAEHDFVLTAPNDPSRKDFAAWADFARDALGNLKTRYDGETTELVDFLKTARTTTPKDGVVALCRDGTAPDDGDCNWDSGGLLSIEVKPGANTTQITVIEAVSG